MGKPVNSNVERAETTPLNTKVNKEVFEQFKDCLAYQGYPMNVVLETFMRQYTDGGFELEEDEIMKWKIDEYEVATLNTTFNKEIYTKFRYYCRGNGYFVKHVIMAFMKRYTEGNLIMKFVELETDK